MPGKQGRTPEGAATGVAAARGGERERALRELRSRRVVLVGLGVSNQALLRFLLAQGVKRIAGGDVKPFESLGPAAGWLASLPIDLRLGPDYLSVLDEAEVVFLTPGIRKNLPEIAAARERGARITSEIGLLLELCRATTVGITGSAGKTTTTTMAGEMLMRSGRRVFVGGNIGTPLIERSLEFTSDETVVLELSSFQLQLVNRSPNVGAMLNLAPNHLDVHKDLDEYRNAKRGVYRYQRPGDWAVFGVDSPKVLAMAKERAAALAAGEGYLAAGGIALFGKDEPPAVVDGVPVDSRAWLDGDRLVLTVPGSPEPAVLCRRDEVRLIGEHNLLNLLAAAQVCLLAGGTLEAAARVATTFEGIEHRLEPAGEIDGVAFINDSIGTAPDRTEVALATFGRPIHLILGGSDKKIPFDGLGQNVVGCGKVTKVILLGETAPKIRRALEEAMERAGTQTGDPSRATRSSVLPVLVEVSSLDEAVREGLRDAAPGTTVLLSPACASFDMFEGYKARGKAFKEAVRHLRVGTR